MSEPFLRRNLRRLMTARGETVGSLALMAGCDEALLRDLLEGRPGEDQPGEDRPGPGPGAGILAALAAALDCSPEALLAEDIEDPEDRPALGCPEAQRAYHATRVVLSTMTRQGMLDLQHDEVDAYALAIAQAATKPELQDQEQLDAFLNGTLLRLQDFRGLRRRG